MELKLEKEWIIFEDTAFLVIDKPVGIPVQPDPTGDVSLIDLANKYYGADLFLCHRIDRPVGGVTIFAKHKQAAAYLNEQFAEGRVRKTYLAVVEKMPPYKESEVIHYISNKSNQNKAIALDKPASEKDLMAKLYYRHLGSSDRYHLLQVSIQTGRHHQIRSQLSAIGCPIKGDVKYGARRKNADRSIHLHAWRAKFTHIQGKGRNHIHATAPLPTSDPLWKFFADFLEETTND